jgi:cobalt-zinc-cadmium resistance protein CzcA
VPRLSEGAIAVSVIRLTGTDLDDSIKYNTQMEKAVLATFPEEVEHVWSRVGTAEIATDPMGIELTDMFMTLKPRKEWKRAQTQAELTELIEKELRDMPGQKLAFLQPIEMRMNEMVSGTRADVAIKLYGDDLDVLTAKGKEIEAIVNRIPGSADVSSEQITGQPVLQIKLDQQQLARYGVPAKVVTDVIESIGSKPVGEVIEGQLRFPLVVRLPEKLRQGSAAIGSILIPTASGERLPLERLAEIRMVEGPATITREWGQRRTTVSVNVRGRDVGSFVAETRQRIQEQLKLPPGRYFYEFGGQFEHLQRARTRLLIVVPVALALIFFLLYVTYHNFLDALRVFTGVPFAWVGGIFALWLRDMPFSISAGIGFIALSGVAVLDDMILVSYIRQLRDKGMSLIHAVEDAAVTRLRPVLMTTLVASLGFIPMATSTGMGAEVQRPLATVVIGGVLSAMVMSLLVLRVLYVVFKAPVASEADEPAIEKARDLVEVGSR